MKIEKERDKLLTNFEVLGHLQQVSSTKRTGECENLETILVELQGYLRDRPAGNTEGAQTTEGITEFMKQVHNHGLELEKAEKLQLINSAPGSLPVLFTLVEECEERFNEEQMNTLVELSKQHLGSEPQPVVQERE